MRWRCVRRTVCVVVCVRTVCSPCVLGWQVDPVPEITVVHFEQVWARDVRSAGLSVTCRVAVGWVGDA